MLYGVLLRGAALLRCFHLLSVSSLPHASLPHFMSMSELAGSRLRNDRAPHMIERWSD